MTVYRGQGMSCEHFNQLQTGGLLSMNYFMSTSTDKNTALKFIEQALSKTSENQAVLFEMNINVKNSIKPFYDISQLSFYKGENEVLFSMATVFRIKSIQQTANRTWYIHLILVEEEDTELKILTEHIRKEIDTTNDLLALGTLMAKMSEYKKAKTYYEYLLKDLPSDKLQVLALYRNITAVHISLDNIDEAAKYQNKVFEILLEILMENFGDNRDEVRNFIKKTSIDKILEIVQEDNHNEILNSIKKSFETELIPLPEKNPGNVESSNKIEGDQMIEQLLKVMTSVDQLPKVVPSCNNIASFLNNQADTNIDQLLELSLQILPENHQKRVTIYNQIGIVRQSQGNYIEALDYFNKAFEIQVKLLPENHPDIVCTYNNIGEVYRSQDNYNKALEYFNKALEIQVKSLTENHQDIARTHKNIEEVRKCL
ncbi:unnamed protein product [Rotaria sp. Silwood2]|nr:unnamed protein product [Rotaria sp. Silwood2]CAF4647838.1 unnamed protein product [Rotaria sp. Silwood2]